MNNKCEKHLTRYNIIQQHESNPLHYFITTTSTFNTSLRAFFNIFNLGGRTSLDCILDLAACLK